MAKALMIQGTMSNAGKSIIVTGLCRIFKQDGFKVAPFKAQNMALNSYITKDGLEMGRAQAVQAEAACIEPSAYMNPILLKPTDNKCSQIIVNGEVWDSMPAKEYYNYKERLVPEVEKAYRELAADNEIIVLEGAGSPAEINLRDKDIVNMFAAKMADAPVLLVGDIERGGVFASLAGTMQLFDEEEKSLVAGFIINKFRGELSILEPGLNMLKEITGKPVIGVLPYLDIDIEEEDSLSDKFTEKFHGRSVDIVVVKTPRLANFTDFEVFELIEDVEVRYVNNKAEMGEPDLILLGGSKNPMGDLLWMRQNGIEGEVKKFAANGKPIIGICGGYQMLGRRLTDPQLKGNASSVRGMELLPINTTYRKEIIKNRITGEFLKIGGELDFLTGKKIEGYETHMGVSKVEEERHIVSFRTEDGGRVLDGMAAGNVYGTYVHGLFDAEGVATSIIRNIMKKKGIDSCMPEDFNLDDYKEQQYDRLADAMRRSIDMSSIYEILNLVPKNNEKRKETELEEGGEIDKK